jgi:hypothetical protein
MPKQISHRSHTETAVRRRADFSDAIELFDLRIQALTSRLISYLYYKRRCGFCQVFTPRKFTFFSQKNATEIIFYIDNGEKIEYNKKDYRITEVSHEKTFGIDACRFADFRPDRL